MSCTMARTGVYRPVPMFFTARALEAAGHKGGRWEAFLSLMFCWKQEWVVTVTGFGLSLEECQVTTRSSNLSLVHLRICTLSVVELGGLKHHMHGAHYLVFSGVEEKKQLEFASMIISVTYRVVLFFCQP